MEGKAVIEPISGVNETFKLAYKGDKLSKDVPVAIKDPCSFCGQSKDDILEHSRLYSLKLLNPDSSSVTAETQEVIVSYPLCNYCLIKLRTICDFFAKIRLISKNVYKLKQSNQFESRPPLISSSRDRLIVRVIWKSIALLRKNKFSRKKKRKLKNARL